MEKQKTLNLNRLRTTKEKVYFRILLFLSFPFWIWIFSPIGIPFLTESTDFTLSGLGLTALIIIGFQLLIAFMSFWALAYIRLNGIKIGPEQFPKLFTTTQSISQQLHLKEPPAVFVINSGGLLNAFATKLAFRRVIVLYSDLVDALQTEKDDTQLRAVLTHELAHHALGHTDFWVNLLISPAEIIYLLSNALSRARETSADRVMKEIIQDEEVCARSLIKLAGGGKIGQTANLKAYVKQPKEEYDFFAWFAEIHASHPFLPKRIKAIAPSLG